MKKRTCDTKRVSVSALAAHLGVTRQYMARWLASDGQGRVTADADGKIDVDRGRLAYLDWLRARRTAKSEAETRYRDLKARHLAIRIAEEEKRLIEVVDALETIDTFGGLVLTELSALPARLAGCNLAGRRSVEHEIIAMRQRVAEALAQQAAKWSAADAQC